jgi:hypothetical protein
MIQDTLKYASADPGIEIRGCETIFETGSLVAALWPPVGPGRSSGGSPGDKVPGSSWILEILEHVSQVFIFTTFLSFKTGYN